MFLQFNHLNLHPDFLTSFLQIQDFSQDNKHIYYLTSPHNWVPYFTDTTFVSAHGVEVNLTGSSISEEKPLHLSMKNCLDQAHRYWKTNTNGEHHSLGWDSRLYMWRNLHELTTFLTFITLFFQMWLKRDQKPLVQAAMTYCHNRLYPLEI